MKKGKYLFFDLETNGLPISWKAPATDVDNFPRIVQIGFILTTASGEILKRGEFVIKPDGWDIPQDTTDVHGISVKMANETGVPMRAMLDDFLEAVNETEYFVAHNLAFDAKVLAAEYIRMFGENMLAGKKGICTMLRTVNFCALGGRYGKYKWVNLEELYQILFNETFENAHNAVADIEATMRCFWELKKREIITS